MFLTVQYCTVIRSKCFGLESFAFLHRTACGLGPVTCFPKPQFPHCKALGKLKKTALVKHWAQGWVVAVTVSFAKGPSGGGIPCFVLSSLPSSSHSAALQQRLSARWKMGISGMQGLLGPPEIDLVREGGSKGADRGSRCAL